MPRKNGDPKKHIESWNTLEAIQKGGAKAAPPDRLEMRSARQHRRAQQRREVMVRLHGAVLIPLDEMFDGDRQLNEFGVGSGVSGGYAERS
jgi:hypothetical protein